jgi:hypothetical protein
MTHALVDRLKRYFLEPTNLDVLAFHEGFADVVALFQHFTFQDVLRDHIQRDRTGLRRQGLLVDLARQFGYASGGGKALRSAIGQADRKLSDDVTEPHERGSILVAAEFDAFWRRAGGFPGAVPGPVGRGPEVGRVAAAPGAAEPGRLRPVGQTHAGYGFCVIITCFDGGCVHPSRYSSPA